MTLELAERCVWVALFCGAMLGWLLVRDQGEG